MCVLLITKFTELMLPLHFTSSDSEVLSCGIASPKQLPGPEDPLDFCLEGKLMLGQHHFKWILTQSVHCSKGNMRHPAAKFLFCRCFWLSVKMPNHHRRHDSER